MSKNQISMPEQDGPDDMQRDAAAPTTAPGTDPSKQRETVLDLPALLKATGIGLVVVDRAGTALNVFLPPFDPISISVPRNDNLLSALAAALAADSEPDPGTGPGTDPGTDPGTESRADPDGRYDLLAHVAEGFSRGELVEREVRTRSGRRIIVRTAPFQSEGGVDNLAVIFIESGRPAPILTARQWLAGMVTPTADATIDVDRHGTVTGWNGAASRLYGRSDAQAVGHSIASLFSDDRWRSTSSPLEQLQRGEHVEPIETTQRRNDGSQVHARLHFSPAHDLSGRYLGASIAVQALSPGRLPSEAAPLLDPDVARQCLDLVDTIVVVIDSHGHIHLINAPDCRALHCGADAAAGRNWFDGFVPERMRDTLRQTFARKLGAPADDTFHLEYPALGGGNREIWIAWRCTIIRDESGQGVGFLCSGRNVTGLRAADEAIRTLEERLRHAVAVLPIPAMLHDDGDILAISWSWKEIGGYSLDETPTVREWTRRAFGRHGSTVHAQIMAPSGLPGSMHDEEWMMTTGSGDRRIWELFSTPLEPDADGRRVMLTTALDNTDLRRLEREVLEINQETRRRIGYDLHDGPASYLSGIAMLVDSLVADIDAGRPISAAGLREIAGLARDGAEQARALAHGLALVGPKPENLLTALADLATATARSYNIACSFSGPATPPTLNHDASAHLYWIAREAVANAVRHSGAGTVTIELFTMWPHLFLRVRDDGAGTDREMQSSEGLGIRIMQYRAAMIGGKLYVRKLPFGGTAITCAAPMIDAGHEPSREQA